MSEWVDLPANSRPRTFAKSVVQELQAQRELVDDTLVVRNGLVVHAPSTTDELQATLVHQHSDLLLHSVILFVPPFGEESGLDVNEPS